MPFAELVRDLGPFWNRDRHTAGRDHAVRGPGAPVFHGDVASGLRVELTLPERVPGLSANSMLMPRPDGGWEVFDDDGLVVTYLERDVRVSLTSIGHLDPPDRDTPLEAVRV